MNGTPSTVAGKQKASSPSDSRLQRCASPRKPSTTTSIPTTPNRKYAHIQSKVTSGPTGFVKNVAAPKPPLESQPWTKNGATPAPTNFESPCIVASVPDISVVVEDNEKPRAVQFADSPVRSAEVQSRISEQSPGESIYSLPIPSNTFSPVRPISQAAFPPFTPQLNLPHYSPMPFSSPSLMNGFGQQPFYAPVDPMAMFQSPFLSSSAASMYPQTANPMALYYRIQQQETEINALRYQVQMHVQKYAQLQASIMQPVAAKEVWHSECQTEDGFPNQTHTTSAYEVTSHHEPQENSSQGADGSVNLEKMNSPESFIVQPKSTSHKDLYRHMMANVEALLKQPYDQTSIQPAEGSFAAATNDQRTHDLHSPTQASKQRQLSEISVTCNKIAASYLNVEPSRPGVLESKPNSNSATGGYGLELSIASVNYLQRHGLPGGGNVSKLVKTRRTANLMESVAEYSEEDWDRCDLQDENQNGEPTHSFKGQRHENTARR